MNKKNETGAVSEEDFLVAFDETPVIEVNTVRDFREIMSTICQKLRSDDWQLRVDNLRQLRSVYKGSELNTDEFVQSLKNMDLELKGCISDLRSQVVREACITVAYFSREMKNKVDIIIEQLLENLLNLVPNGAKIMSSSGKTALKIIVCNTQGIRILPFFLTSMSISKSTSVRQFSSEIVKIICEKWQVKCLEKNVSNIAEALKKGISDADEQARSNSREAFCWFNMKFPQYADKLLQSLDSNKHKVLTKEMSLFTEDFSADVVDNGPRGFKVPPPRSMKTAPLNVTAQMSNTVGRNRINSAKSETQSANNSSECIYVKPYFGFGFRGVKPKMLPPRYDSVNDRGRQMKISQSQPATRESSPQTPQVSYTNGITHESKKSAQSDKKIVQNVYGSSRSKEMEAEDIKKLTKTTKLSHDSYPSDDDQDEASEASSVASDYVSSFNELTVLLNSKVWNDRKRGLTKIKTYIQEYQLKPAERKSLIEIFNSMFLENQTAVVNKFLEVLYKFIQKYHEYIDDWGYSLIVRLLNMLSNDRLKACTSDINRILILTIDVFGPPVAFAHCCKYLIDKNEELGIKVKISLLEYMKNVLTVAQPNLLDKFNGDNAQTLGNLIMLTTETKSSEICKLSSRLVVRLFDLNSDQFTRILSTLPQSFQERATSILDVFITNYEATKQEQVPSNGGGETRTLRHKKTTEIIKINTEALQNISLNGDGFEKQSVVSNSSSRSNRSLKSPSMVASKRGSVHNRPGNIPMLKSPCPNGTSSPMYNDSGNMQRYIASQISHPDLSMEVSSNYSPSLYPSTSNESNVDSKYNQVFYSSGPINSALLSKRDPARSNSELAPKDVMFEILKELSNHNDRYEERRACLFKLIKIFREKTPTDWDEHFKTLLFLLLETMGDNDAEMRAQSLRVLQDLAKNQGARFMEYSQLTILRVLEAHKDSDKSVVKSAEECSRVLTMTMPREICLKMLVDIISDGDENQLCLAGLKMLTKLIKTCDRQIIESDLDSLCEALSLVVNHKDSAVRKESILCLVEVHKEIGEDVWCRVKLTNSQIRLLEVYIKKNSS